MQLLQQQVGVLQDSSNHNDERYTRAKADNAALQARVIMLEEQLREAEMRHEDRLQVNQNSSLFIKDFLILFFTYIKINLISLCRTNRRDRKNC